MTFIHIIIIYKTTFILIVCYMCNWYLLSLHSFNIHTTQLNILYIALSLNNPKSTYLAPSSCDRNRPPSFQVARKLSLFVPRCPHASFPSIFYPFWVFPQPNVLLIRTHPKPLPSGQNSPPWGATINNDILHVFTSWCS
jgi:hypothetical protein